MKRGEVKELSRLSYGVHSVIPVMVRIGDTALNGGLEGLFILVTLLVVLAQTIASRYSSAEPVLFSS